MAPSPTPCPSGRGWRRAICRRYQLDLPRQRVEEIIREMYFRSLTQSARWFIDTYHLAAEPQEIVDLAWQVMARAYRESARLKPGAARYLEQAHRRGMPLWVATGQRQGAGPGGAGPAGGAPVPGGDPHL